GAKKIVVEDAYVRKPYQLRNLAEFLEMLLRCKKPDEDVAVHLVTGHNDPGFVEAQLNGLNELASAFSQLGVNLTYEFRDTLHDRSITADTGWEILPGRGLDIFQKFVDGDWLNPLLRHQQLRRVKECKVTYQRVSEK
ncbi:MAG: MIT C-terminal domain-containing protein, partial [Bifidobacterium bifidum]|nr:MIT C-terminal domain-containing protein [Bifidobacterium bifidum]